MAKTLYLHNNRDAFMNALRWDIGALIKRAAKLGLKPAVRINGTSDLPQIARTMAREFPNVQFYDYTKIPRPELRVLPNYHLTFSYTGHNDADAMGALANGVNVAVVFDTRRGYELPEEWRGYRVVDGDLHDLRFTDAVGVVVGLRAKGAAIGADSAFVVRASAPAVAPVGPPTPTHADMLSEARRVAARMASVDAAARDAVGPFVVVL